MDAQLHPNTPKALPGNHFASQRHPRRPFCFPFGTCLDQGDPMNTLPSPEKKPSPNIGNDFRTHASPSLSQLPSLSKATSRGVGGLAQPLQSAALGLPRCRACCETPLQDLSDSFRSFKPPAALRIPPGRPHVVCIWSRFRPESHPKSFQEFARFLDRFLSIFGSNMETEITPQSIKNDLETSSNPDSDFHDF